MDKQGPPPRQDWFAIRRDLPADRRRLLMACSFVSPILLWCLFAYTPYFHSDIRLIVTADRGDSTKGNYSEGDRVAKSYFASFAEEIRDLNRQTLADRAQGKMSARRGRVNVKRLRALRGIAESNGAFEVSADADTEAIDARLVRLFGEIAEGRVVLDSPALSAENLEIVKSNWVSLSRHMDEANPVSVSEPLLQLVPQGHSASPVFLPAPHECVTAAIRDFSTEPANGQPWMHQRLVTSLGVVFGGFLVACAIGVPLGLLCGTYDFFAKLFEPFLDFFRYMPAPTFSLLLVAIFGVQGAPKIALVAIGTFPHLVLMLANTTRQVDGALLEAAQTLGASRINLVSNVVVPGVLPNMYNDLRVLLGWAWTWLVIAELIGEKTGLTGFIDTQGDRRNFERVFPIIVMIGVIGFFTDQFLQAIARRLFPWASANKQ